MSASAIHFIARAVIVMLWGVGFGLGAWVGVVVTLLIRGYVYNHK